MPLPAPFSEAWSLEDTRQHLQMVPYPSQGSFQQQNAWREDVLAPAHAKLSASIGRHVAWVMGQGKRVLPAHCENVSLPLIRNLRRLSENMEGKLEQMLVGEHFADQMRVEACFLQPASKPLDPVSAHANLAQVIGQGRFRFYCADMGADPLSGERLDILFDGWEATAGRRGFSRLPGSPRHAREFTPLLPGDIPRQVVETVELPVPTGELWLTDWIRIPAFQKLSAPLDSCPGHDINTVAGRATRTRHYAQQLGVGHVAFGSPSITQDKGVIQAGFLSPSASPSANLVGEVNADLRWTTLVDRGHLVSLLTPILGHDQALKQVQDYERSNSDLIKVHVEPGSHHLYFAGSPTLFGNTIQDQFQTQDLSLEAFEQPAFVLTQAPLLPSPDLGPSQALARSTPAPRL